MQLHYILANKHSQLKSSFKKLHRHLINFCTEPDTFSPLPLQTRQLVTVCDSKLLSSAILALAAARPEFTQQGTPSPSSSSLSPSSRSPSRSPSRHPTSPSRPATSPSRHAAPPEGSEGSKSKRTSLQADWHEEEWVRADSDLYFIYVLSV